MKIFSNEFINLLKKIFICFLVGHKFAWMEYYWAIGHATGMMMYTCRRCCTTTHVRTPDIYYGKKLETLGEEMPYKEWIKRKDKIFIKEK